MANGSLELTIISAKGLNRVNLIGKMVVYAVVYIDGAGNHDQKQKTHVDKDGDSNPTWNYPMKFQIDEMLQNRLSLVVKVKAEGMFGDKDVGEVYVPVKELLDGGLVGGKPLQFVTYQVRKPSGQPKGELSFSYRFGKKSGGIGGFEEPVMAFPTGYLNSEGKVNNLDEPVLAYPMVASNNSVYPPPMVASDNSVYPALAVASEYSSVYPPSAAGMPMAGDGIYPPVGGEYYPPLAGYPQSSVGYAYHQQPAYVGYPPMAGSEYGGYPPQ